ncbi:MAG: redoxin domain-containing protein, partial [Polyangiaceae bacterium]
PYPSGPYGITAGSVITNMSWIGYVDDAADAVATTKPYVAYTLDDARQSGKHYAMINLAELDCPGCQKSAGELQTGAAAVVDAGGVVIEVLETAGFTKQATQANLQAWINKYSLPITTVKDPDGTGTVTLNALGGREQCYVVDLTTMKILQVIKGDITGIGATSGGLCMTQMHTLLGK